MKKKKDYKRVKCFNSVFLMVGLTFMMLMAFGLLIFFYAYEPSDPQNDNEPWMLAIATFMLGVLPVLVIIFEGKRAYSVTVIDENGIRYSLFRILFRREILWTDLKQMRIYMRGVVPFLALSREGTLDDTSYDKALKRKDVMIVEFNEKIYSVIKRYTEIPIIGMDNN